MVEKLEKIIKEYENLMVEMSSPNIMSNMKKYKELARQEKTLSVIIPSATSYIKKNAQLKDDEEILKGNDKELKELVKDEIVELKEELKSLEEKLKILLLPKDPNDNRNTILEIRSGTGGNEAALFAEDLFRMYLRFCETIGVSCPKEVKNINGQDIEVQILPSLVSEDMLGQPITAFVALGKPWTDKSGKTKQYFDCKFCKNSFCGNHRLPEMHKCPNLDDCKKKAFDDNTQKLTSSS